MKFSIERADLVKADTIALTAGGKVTKALTLDPTTAVIAVVALLRELFGLGTVWGQEIAFLKAHAVASLQKPMGGFLVYAIVAAIVNALFPAACAAEEEPGFAGVAAGTAEGGNE